MVTDIALRNLLGAAHLSPRDQGFELPLCLRVEHPLLDGRGNLPRPEHVHLDSALHASCTKVRSEGARLLLRAQAEGTARPDIDGADLFALIGGLAWIGDQPAFAPRGDHLIGVITSAILTNRSRSDGEEG